MVAGAWLQWRAGVDPTLAYWLTVGVGFGLLAWIEGACP